MYQHISPREELIKQAKELRKSVYKIDASMHDKMPKKRESTGLLEDQIEYTKELLNLLKKDVRFTTIPNINEKINMLEETMNDTEYEIEYSKDKDAKVGHKTADTSFFGYKTHIAMTPERIITAAIITTGEKHAGKQLQTLVEKSQENGIEVYLFFIYILFFELAIVTVVAIALFLALIVAIRKLDNEKNTSLLDR